MLMSLSQLQPRSVLIAQQPVSIFKAIIQTETFHSNNIVYIGSLSLHALCNCVEIFRKEGQDHKLPRLRKR